MALPDGSRLLLSFESVEHHCEDPNNWQDSVWYEYMRIDLKAHVDGGNGCCQRDSLTGQCSE